ncbi:hypothetical protein CALCODRAFT_367017 [Calocera cornea HHB12733]|uniref:Uncharacterized protein n=1 Tax=Calocera cornea HHB12733 TaxID=1353952 RepID=A0A165JA69_9BASI|nr:hypothetical protein CALCODRAFT_367017 [Calocera cornea HHB12733]
MMLGWTPTPWPERRPRPWNSGWASSCASGGHRPPTRGSPAIPPRRALRRCPRTHTPPRPPRPAPNRPSPPRCGSGSGRWRRRLCARGGRRRLRWPGRAGGCCCCCCCCCCCGCCAARCGCASAGAGWG